MTQLKYKISLKRRDELEDLSCSSWILILALVLIFAWILILASVSILAVHLLARLQTLFYSLCQAQTYTHTSNFHSSTTGKGKSWVILSSKSKGWLPDDSGMSQRSDLSIYIFIPVGIRESLLIANGCIISRRMLFVMPLTRENTSILACV